MKTKEIKETLKNLVINWEITFEDIKYYLRVNRQTLKDITSIKKHNDWHVLLEVNNQIVGII